MLFCWQPSRPSLLEQDRSRSAHRPVAGQGRSVCSSAWQLVGLWHRKRFVAPHVSGAAAQHPVQASGLPSAMQCSGVPQACSCCGQSSMPCCAGCVLSLVLAVLHCFAAAAASNDRHCLAETSRLNCLYQALTPQWPWLGRLYCPMQFIATCAQPPGAHVVRCRHRHTALLGALITVDAHQHPLSASMLQTSDMDLVHECVPLSSRPPDRVPVSTITPVACDCCVTHLQHNTYV